MILSFDFAAPTGDVNFVLPPLTARVYQLDFNAMPNADYDTTVTVAGTVESKFYDPADTGTNACVNDPDSSSLPIMVAAGQDETRFVLIANTSSSSNQVVTVSFAGDANPMIDIVSPLQNAVFDENDLISFNAIATGFMGADPNLVNISWSYERGGVPIVFANSKSGEAFDERLCDGSYTVTAEALDATSSQMVSDSVSFVVSDLGSSGNPPLECRPTITILEPSSGQTFAVGQNISLRAAIDDDHPETDDPLYPITWRDGGPSGTIIGTGLEATAKLSEGAHQIYVSYGVANMTVGILVEAGNPPTADITSPSGDIFIPWTDVPGCDSIFTLTGTGSDPEDGALTGNSLTWRYRQNGSNSFFLGNGTSVDLNIRCGNTYEVTLTAEDLGGLEDNDVVTITVGAPPS